MGDHKICESCGQRIYEKAPDDYIVGILANLNSLYIINGDLGSILPSTSCLKIGLKGYIDNVKPNHLWSYFSALYDALTYRNVYFCLTRKQWRRVHEITLGICQYDSLDNDKVYSAIHELEEIGIDTTPF